MATSTCIKCNGTSFELKEYVPKNSAVNFYFIQCTQCGGVVGLSEPYSYTKLIYKLAEKLNVDLDT